jgi:hypothetical protein
VAGGLAFPVLGNAKFAYRFAGKQVDTDVGATMCERCGAITLTAEDPGRITRTHEALRRAHLTDR